MNVLPSSALLIFIIQAIQVRLSLSRGYSNAQRRSSDQHSSEIQRDICTPEIRQFHPDHTNCARRGSNLIEALPLSLNDQDAVVRLHNKYRSATEPPASNMMKIYWNLRLAETAQRKAETCNNYHDGPEQRVIPEHNNTVGQNLAWGQKTWSEAMDAWHSEVTLYTYGQDSRESNHYIQMILWRTGLVGCGLSLCEWGNGPQYYYVCNYDQWIFSDDIPRPYNSGARCSECARTCQDGLCDCGGRFCHNKGQIIPGDCKCTCPESYEGDFCEKTIQHDDSRYDNDNSRINDYRVYQNDEASKQTVKNHPTENDKADKQNIDNRYHKNGTQYGENRVPQNDTASKQNNDNGYPGNDNANKQNNDNDYPTNDNANEQTSDDDSPTKIEYGDDCTPQMRRFRPDHTNCALRGSNLIKSMPISERDKEYIVELHNKARSSPDPSASNMLKIHWSPVLAATAQKLADSCVRGYEEPDQRIIPKYMSSVGQNLGYGNENLATIIKRWFDEASQYTYGTSTNAVNHYIQIISWQTVLVGCGLSVCRRKSNRDAEGHLEKYFVCNYHHGVTPADYDRPYKSGSRCADCPHNCRDGLCDCRGRICNNGGTMNPGTCKCNCPKDFHGDHCERIKCEKADDYFCGSYPDFLVSNCTKLYMMVTCPRTCGRCEGHRTANTVIKNK